MHRGIASSSFLDLLASAGRRDRGRFFNRLLGAVYVGVYRIELHIPASRSLKAKRSVVNAIRARLTRMNLAVAEVDGQDLWQSCVLGAAAVSADAVFLDNLADKIEDACYRDGRAQVLRIQRDVIPFG
jgi:hypothetical protein